MTPIIETARLILREFVESDVAAFYGLGSDPAILRFTHDPGGGLKSHEQALEIMRARPIADYRKHGYGRWACVLKETGEIIGFAGLKYLDDLAEVDVGYRFLPAHWGKGLATEAGRPIVDYGFNRLKLPRILGIVDPDNTASKRVLEKLGLRFVEAFEYGGVAAWKYVLTAEEFASGFSTRQ